MAVRRRLTGAGGILALALALGGCDGGASTADLETAIDVSAIAATVNGQPIYAVDVQMEAEIQGMVDRGERLEIDSAEFNQILDELIDVKLLAMEAETRGLEEDPQARHRLESARQHILGNILIDAVVAERVDEAAIRKMYDAQIAIWELGEEARVRHILAPTREEIERIEAELRTGLEFAVVASRRSVDEATRMEGGDLGYMTPEEASPEFARMIRATATGELSDPFETEMGWHIARIDERREEQPPSLEELRGPILNHLTTMQIGEVLKELRKSGRIEKLTSPQNSTLEVDPFAVPAPEPEPAADGASNGPPSFEASGRGATADNDEAEQPSPAPAQPQGPVSESREGVAQ